MINFGFGVHIHQPIGNFDSVIEDAYQKAYKPFLDLAYQFPNIKINYHISGCLLEWVIKHHPEFVDSLKELVKKKQIEILTSGFYEPVLTLLPKNDQVDQIKWYSDFLAEKFGVYPKGLWLSERVWEQKLTESLFEAGIKYTVVDDTHFKYSGLTDDELWGYYVTEDDGRTLAVFPINKKLRYLIPFKPIMNTVDFLKTDEVKGFNRLRLLFDDGEKFGSWPNTYKHCYEDGWLKEFFATLEKSDFIQTTLLSNYLDSSEPLGRIYLDNSSYEEMAEWVLFPKVFPLYAETKEKLQPDNPFLRGGYFRNFLVKYPEANRLHKRMLYISKKIQSHKPKVQKAAKIELFKGQCNDAYWHGIFGGLYLPHLRQSVYHHLLNADRLIRINRQASFFLFDFDACGKEEIVFDSKDIFLVVAPARGGSLLCLDLKKYRVNLLDIIGRRRENYHLKIKSLDKVNAESGDSIKTIHSELKLKDTEIEHYLVYDNYERLSLLDHFLPPSTTVEDFYYNRAKQVYDVMFKNRKYSYKSNHIKMALEKFASNRSLLSKTIVIAAKTIKFSYALNGIAVPPGKPIRFGIEFGFRPLRYLECNQQKIETQTIGEAKGLSECRLFVLNPDIVVSLTSPNSIFDLWYFPIYSVSSSEQGLERIYQGTILLLSWLLKKPENDFELELNW